MVTLGFTYSYSDLAVAGVPFPYLSSYLYVQTAGDIVYMAPNGSLQWVQGAGIGYHPIAASQIVTSGTVNGSTRTTTAVGVVYCCAPKYT